MTRKNRRTRNKSIRKVERRVRNKRTNREDVKSSRKQRRTNRKQRRTNRKQRRTNRKQRRTNRKQRRVKRELYGGAEPAGAQDAATASADVAPSTASATVAPATAAAEGAEGEVIPKIPDPTEVIDKFQKNVVEEAGRQVEAAKPVLTEEISFDKIENLIREMMDDNDCARVETDQRVGETYEEMKKRTDKKFKGIFAALDRRSLRKQTGKTLDEIEKDYKEFREAVYNFLARDKFHDDKTIIRHYKDFKEAGKDMKIPRRQPETDEWVCFKRVIAFATDPEYTRTLRSPVKRDWRVEKKTRGRMPYEINTRNLVKQLIKINEDVGNYDPDIQTDCQEYSDEYDKDFEELKRNVESKIKGIGQVVDSTKMEKKARDNLDEIQVFYKKLNVGIKTCLNGISKWFLKQAKRTANENELREKGAKLIDMVMDGWSDEGSLTFESLLDALANPENRRRVVEEEAAREAEAAREEEAARVEAAGEEEASQNPNTATIDLVPQHLQSQRQQRLESQARQQQQTTAQVRPGTPPLGPSSAAAPAEPPLPPPLGSNQRERPQPENDDGDIIAEARAVTGRVGRPADDAPAEVAKPRPLPEVPAPTVRTGAKNLLPPLQPPLPQPTTPPLQQQPPQTEEEQELDAASARAAKVVLDDPDGDPGPVQQPGLTPTPPEGAAPDNPRLAGKIRPPATPGAGVSTTPAPGVGLVEPKPEPQEPLAPLDPEQPPGTPVTEAEVEPARLGFGVDPKIDKVDG